MPSPPRNPDELGVLWRKVSERTGKTLWSGRIGEQHVVGFTFKTHAGREGMSIQVSRAHLTPVTPGAETP
jgi:hypothetical protein